MHQSIGFFSIIVIHFIYLSLFNAYGDDDNLIGRGEEWLYLDDGLEPPANWHEQTFDDSTWKRGSAPLGYGSDQETLTDFGPDESDKHITTYFRRSFELSEETDPLEGELIAELRVDDSAAVYLNGSEVILFNLSSRDPNSDTLAFQTLSFYDEVRFRPFLLDENLLKPGMNTIAVEVHQASINSSDLIFDMNLTLRSPLYERKEWDPVLEWSEGVILNHKEAPHWLFYNTTLERQEWYAFPKGNPMLQAPIPFNGRVFDVADLDRNGAAEILYGWRQIGVDGSEKEGLLLGKLTGATWTSEYALPHAQYPEVLGGVFDDFDQDDIIDIIASVPVSDFDSRLLFLKGKKDFTFEDPAPIAEYEFRAHQLKSLDYNGDGNRDLILSRFTLLPGSGNGQFGEAQEIETTFNNETLLLDDLNGDSKTDIVLGRKYYLASENGFMDPLAEFPYPQPHYNGIADLDGDGDPDILAWEDGWMYWLLNDGMGAFEKRIPLFPFLEVFGVRDFDGDGLADIFGRDHPQLVMYRKVDPDEPVIDHFTAELPSLDSAGLTNLDWRVRGAEEVLINQSVGKVPSLGEISLHIDETTTFLLTARSASNKTATSEITIDVPLFQISGPVTENGETVSPENWVAGDLNGDGVDEYISAEWIDDQPFVVIRQREGASFEVRRTVDSPFPYLPLEYQIADLDGDGLNDLLLGDGSWYVLRSLGDWQFAEPVLFFEGQHALTFRYNFWPRPQFADFDDDGDPDLFRYVGKLEIFENDLENGPFRRRVSFESRDVTNHKRSFTTIDANKDGYLDVVLGGELFYLENWKVINWTNLLHSGGFFVASGDFDGDGDDDVIVDRGLFEMVDGELVTAPVANVPQLFDAEVVVRDFDGDGDVDVMGLGDGLNWLRNLGSNRFRLERGTDRESVELNRFAVLFADIDDDGDLDLFGHQNVFLPSQRNAWFRNVSSPAPGEAMEILSITLENEVIMLQWSFPMEKSYRIQRSFDLVSWSDLNEVPIPGKDGKQMIPTTHPAAYFRIFVDSP